MQQLHIDTQKAGIDLVEWLSNHMSAASTDPRVELLLRLAGRLPPIPLDRLTEGRLEVAKEQLLAMADAFQRSHKEAPDSATAFVALPRYASTKCPRTGIVEAELIPPIAVPSASASELARVPGLDEHSARRVAEYCCTQQLSSLEQLVEAGIVEMHVLRKATPYLTLKSTDNTDRSNIVTNPDESQEPDEDSTATVDLRRELELLMGFIKDNAYWPEHRPRRDSTDEVFKIGKDIYNTLSDPRNPSIQVASLWGQAYIRVVRTLLESAQRRVFIAMFGLRASGSSKLRCLLDAVIQANDRGLQVGVVHDSDEGTADLWADDVAILTEAGVRCLGVPNLHERTVLVDDHVCVGSVGWTAQSIFLSHEVSLYVESVDISATVALDIAQRWLGGY